MTRKELVSFVYLYRNEPFYTEVAPPTILSTEEWRARGCLLHPQGCREEASQLHEVKVRVVCER